MIAKEARQTIVEDEQLLRLLVNSVADYAIFMLDPTGRVATWSVGAERIKGYSAGDIIGRHFSTFHTEEDLRAGKCELELEVAARVGRFEDEDWRIKKDGSRFWANVVISAVRDASGTLIGFSKVTRDLTERKRIEDARVAAEERFRLLVDSVRDYAIFMLDPDGTIGTWNIGAERINGYRADEIIGRSMALFYPEEDLRAGKWQHELEVATRVGRFEEEGWRLRKDGTRFWANVVLTAVRNRQGDLVGFATVTRDLTEREQAQAARSAREAAEQASRAKDEFLAMLGHELRNPMAPILTALQLMKLRGDDGSSKEQQVIERQVRHMMHLVDDLLDISRITRGKVELKRQHVAVRDVIAKAVEVASPLLEQRRHHFDIVAPSSTILVDGDDARLTQVFANLLTNAAKYTDVGGHITLTVSQRGADVEIEVRDDGIGIDPALLPKVFDLFVQGYQSVDRSSGGLGLGLALVRSIVTMHGGVVEAHSAGAGKGTAFTVRLPVVAVGVGVDPPASASLPHVIASAARPRRVLIVDDNEDALMLIAEALSEAGHDVRSASDPVAALTVIKTFAPDIAVLDIGLPVMDGYELAARMRAELAVAPRLVALTGYGQNHDVARSQAAGFDVHLVKPVEFTRLLDAIAELSLPQPG